jgi:hypothetical protein
LAGEKLDAWLGGKTSFGKVRRYANQIFIKTIDPMIQGAFEQSLGLKSCPSKGQAMRTNR